MSERDSVVIVNHNAGSPWHGPNLRSYYLAKHLVDRGYTVHVFTSGYSHKYVRLPELSRTITDEVIAGARYHWIRTRPYEGTLGRVLSYWEFSTRLEDAISSRVSDVKALVCSSPPPNFSRVCHRITQEYNARFIFEVRDLWPLAIMEMGVASRYNPYILYMGWQERYAYRNADVVVSALPCSESYMRGRGLPPDRFAYIPNGTEVDDEPSVDPAELPREVRQGLAATDPFRVGYAGALNHDNDVDSLLEAAALLREHDIEFRLVGQGPTRERLIDRSRDLPGVEVLPAVRSDQVPWVLDRFDAAYMGLRDKAINQYGVSLNKSFEYMRASLPIVSAIDAGNDPVSEAGCGFSVEPENPRAIADAILQLAEMSERERMEMGERGTVYLREHHSYDVLIEDWIRVIEGTETRDQSR